ncbi:hypothetical protein LOK49_LG14G00864 [Camellia lanceoleosa]|uniref:Uncharacterized protein n=1 Tax=Camellia lanceoleosa TaxID=1840588 RepID=A0ACC0FCA5_9ERIC|nr:hypothetical protein LOK49_LG14G00864 [Camellia lanceoleosa]
MVAMEAEASSGEEGGVGGDLPENEEEAAAAKVRIRVLGNCCEIRSAHRSMGSDDDAIEKKGKREEKKRENVSRKVRRREK